MRATAGHTFLRFADTSVPEFAELLGTRLSSVGEMVQVSPGLLRSVPTPVLDKTGLTGRYDFTFDYAGGGFFGARDRPKIIAAVQNSLGAQLGLKLVEAKVSVRALVIDHIEKTPTEN